MVAASLEVEMAGRRVPPSPEATAFNCPHCDTLTTQTWFRLGAERLANSGLPSIWTEAEVEHAIAEFTSAARKRGDEVNPSEVQDFREEMTRRASGRPLLFGDSEYFDQQVANLHLTRCFECKKLAVWRYNTLLWPAATEAPEANPDLPDAVAVIYEEAASVLGSSPRAAAALLRLCIELLCKHLGGTGSDLNADIGALVGRGLDPRVQRALDIVRVIGNDAVHPGSIDPSDDRPAAEELFRLVNLISEIMITQPKHIDDMYGAIPEGKRKAIEERNAKAIAGPKITS
jgi:hypothetical protein